MPVDVVTEIEIDRPRTEVAAFASDPDNTTAWYENIKAIEWKTVKPLVVGSQIAFKAQFLGRSLSYTYEVIELVPGERFVMRTAEGPFPMETAYSWTDSATGGTRMTMRNRGEPSGFARAGGTVHGQIDEARQSERFGETEGPARVSIDRSGRQRHENGRGLKIQARP